MGGKLSLSHCVCVFLSDYTEKLCIKVYCDGAMLCRPITIDTAMVLFGLAYLPSSYIENFGHSQGRFCMFHVAREQVTNFL